MKNLLSIILILFCVSIFAQENLAINENYNFPPDKLDIQLVNLTTDDAYSIALNWIDKTFKNPSEAIKNQNCGKYIKLEYTENNLYQDHSFLFGKHSFDVKYDIVFTFSDNNILLEIVNAKADYPKTLTSGGWQDLAFSNDDIYKKNGQKNMQLISSIIELQNYFSDLVSNFQDELKNSESTIVVAELN
jgi:hypothetical protein